MGGQWGKMLDGRGGGGIAPHMAVGAEVTSEPYIAAHVGVYARYAAMIDIRYVCFSRARSFNVCAIANSVSTNMYHTAKRIYSARDSLNGRDRHDKGA